MKRGIISALLVALMIILIIITSAPAIASAEISEPELITPEIPSYQPYDFELKPTADVFIEPGYSFSSLIEWSEFYDNSRGFVKVWLKNTGDNPLFIYAYGVETQGLPEGGWIPSKIGLTIYPGEKKYLGIASVYVDDDVDNFSLKQCFALMAKTDKGKWYDYKTVFMEEITEILVNPTLTKREPIYQSDHGNQFTQINKLIFPMDPTIRNTAIQTAKKHPGAYNIYQVCGLFDYVVVNTEYVSDPRGLEYMAKPCETLIAGAGDCDDYSILLAALIDAIGGTPRIYMTDNHMFAAVYIGDENNINCIESAIGKYYNTPITLHYLTDDSGVWLLLDPTNSLYAGGLPGGAKPTRTGWTFENATNISVIDITPYFKDIQEGVNMTDLIFCSYIRGDQDYDKQSDATYDSGDTVWMYHETFNFDVGRQDGTYDVWLKHSLKVFDSDNNIVYEDLDWDEFHESDNTVPGAIWSSDNFGTSNYQKDQYKVEMTVKDMISGESKTITGYFMIGTAPAEPGFEIVFAIAGLLAVAYLLGRRK
ncbi:MAG: PGF-CTERM sorting domain-containing protein [Methanosarcinaceae archaeon]